MRRPKYLAGSSAARIRHADLVEPSGTGKREPVGCFEAAEALLDEPGVADTRDCSEAEHHRLVGISTGINRGNTRSEAAAVVWPAIE